MLIIHTLLCLDAMLIPSMIFAGLNKKICETEELVDSNLCGD